MSTKTLRKRIALVAVSALGAGVLSLVAVPAANATGIMTIFANSASNTLTSATCANNSTGYGSQGLVTQTGTGTTITATLLSSGKLLVFVPATAATQNTLTVSGGVVTRAVGDSTDPTVSAGQTLVTAASGKNICAEISPTVAVGATMTINSYSGSYASTNPVGTAVVTIASANAAGVVSVAKSKVYVKASTAKGSMSTGSDTVDSATGFTVANGAIGGLYIDLDDAYNGALTSGTLTVSATNGAIVKIASDYGTGSLDNNTSYTGAATYASVAQGTANVAGSTDVTVSFNGTVVATKTIKFLGDATSIQVKVYGDQRAADYAATTLASNATYGQLLTWTLKDAAGNIVPEPNAVSLDSGSNAFVTGVTVSNALSMTRVQAGLTGTGYWGCSGATGSASLKLKATNAAGATVYSDAFTVKCAKDPVTYTIASDKSSYAPGEIATFTVTVKDSAGNVPATIQNMGVTMANATATACTNSTANQPTLTSGAFKSLVVTPSCADYWDSNGQVKYKAVVDNAATDGNYTVVFDAPGIDAQALGGAAQTATIAVKSTSASVTNAEVLAAIVKLIASINQQIAALQKALTKKK